MGFGSALAIGFLKGQTEKMAAKRTAASELAKEDREYQRSQNELAVNLLGDFMQSEDVSVTLPSGFSTENLTPAQVFTMATQIKDAADGYTKLGSGAYATRLPFEVDFGKKDSVFNSLSQFELYLSQNGQDLINAASQDATVARDLTTFVGQLYNQNNLFHHDAFSKTDDAGKFSSHAYREYQKSLPNFYKLATAVGVIETSQFNPAFISPEDSAPGTFHVTESVDVANGTVTQVPVDMSTIPGGYAGDGAMDALASYHRMPQGRAQIFSNLDFMAYGSDETAGLEDINNGAKLLSANAQDYELLEGAISSTTARNTVSLVRSIGRGTQENGFTDLNEGRITRAFYTIVKEDPEFVGAPPNQLTGVSGTKYLEDVEGYKVAEFRDQSTANEESLDLLYKYRMVQEEYGKTGLTAALEKFGISVVAQGKQLTTLFSSSDYSELSNKATYAEGTSQASLMEVAATTFGIDNITKLNQIQALQLTLAARMARAVDPSGRLSDQDFRIQLERLSGTGIFTTLEGTLAKIDEVISEFEDRQKGFDKIKSIMAKENITVEDRRFIRATKMADRAIRESRKMYRQGIAPPASEQGEKAGDGKEPTQPSLVSASDLEGIREDRGVYRVGPNGERQPLFTHGGNYYVPAGEGQYLLIPNAEVQIGE